MNKLEQYFELILKVGVKLKSGDRLCIYYCGHELKWFAEQLMQKAYEYNAADVAFYFSSSDALCFEKRCNKMVWIYTALQYENIKLPKMPRTVICVPTKDWAHQVFPHLTIETALETMWTKLFDFCRIDDCDIKIVWEKHLERLNKKASLLNNYNFRSLHITNKKGTDLNMQLPDNHQWLTCTTQCEGDMYVNNIPTEEVFTAPISSSVNGIVHSTKPIVFKNTIIDEFWFEFKNGEVVDCFARRNQSILQELLSINNANYLGEIAIVPYNTPISQADILWYDTSLDENASCHIALGYSYVSCFGKDIMDMATLISKGFNQSSIHQDIMIGSLDMQIVAKTYQCEDVVILSDGEWTI